MKNRRLGVIRVTHEMIDKEPGVISDAFHMVGFVPIEISSSLLLRRFEYLGISPKFTEVAEGSCAPVYMISISKDNEVTVMNEGVQFEN